MTDLSGLFSGLKKSLESLSPELSKSLGDLMSQLSSNPEVEKSLSGLKGTFDELTKKFSSADKSKVEEAAKASTSKMEEKLKEFEKKLSSVDQAKVDEFVKSLADKFSNLASPKQEPITPTDPNAPQPAPSQPTTSVSVSSVISAIFGVIRQLFSFLQFLINASGSSIFDVIKNALNIIVTSIRRIFDSGSINDPFMLMESLMLKQISNWLDMMASPESSVGLKLISIVIVAGYLIGAIVFVFYYFLPLCGWIVVEAEVRIAWEMLLSGNYITVLTLVLALVITAVVAAVLSAAFYFVLAIAGLVGIIVLVVLFVVVLLLYVVAIALDYFVSAQSKDAIKQTISGALGSIAQAIVYVIVNFASSAGLGINAAGILSIANEVVNQIMAIIFPIIDIFYSTIMPVVKFIYNGLASAFEYTLTTLVVFIKSNASGVSNILQALTNDIKHFLDSIINFLGGPLPVHPPEPIVATS